MLREFLRNNAAEKFSTFFSSTSFFERKNTMNLPNDPIILLSFINTKLRDEYPTLEELCKGLCVSKEDIEEKLKSVGYIYSSETNSFK